MLGGVLNLFAINNINQIDASNISFMANFMPMILLFMFFAVYMIFRNMKRAVPTQFRGHYIRFIDRVAFGWDRTIIIFEVQGWYYIALMDKNGIKIVDKRDDILEIDMTSKSAFKSILSKFNVDKDSE